MVNSYRNAIAKRRLSKWVIILMGILGVFNLIGSMVMINLVVINPPPPPFKCDYPSIRAGAKPVSSSL